ncbi:hypothetical protein CRI94_16130 [Longibacter salinarum]|uniref:Peptidase n=1 Tax=Longibacter salinarum TaxID=1850348 RepID=A0A2A8CU90_9BACT|nr:PepSY-associated TM helix domain-containing protein [Longibacter salinarum]PEN11314.1 hypothetical protein CRI94_16130 [Longibacter salinarum]
MPKLPSRAYKLLWDAHSAAGIVIGLALFVIFATGALLLYRGEIRQWEEPSLRHTPGESQSLTTLTQPVLDSLSRGDGDPSYVYMTLPGAEHANLYMYLTGGTVGASHDVWVNPTTGAWVSNPDEGAVTRLLYYLHFFFQLGTWGLYLSGFVALLGLLAVTTGTAVHIDRLVKDFLQFRPTKKLRVAWADAHKVLGTIGLPFQTMYVFTGAYFGLVGLIALPYASLLFGGNVGEFYREAGYYAPTVTVDSVATAQHSPQRLDELATRAASAWDDFTPQTMILHSVDEPDGRVEVLGRTDGTVFGGTGSVVFHARTGEVLLREAPSEAGALNDAVQSMEMLHFAEFGGQALKLLFFLLGIASCSVILTGNLTWLEVRRAKNRWIHRMLARLTAGVATGMLPALALLFLTDRWLPASVSQPGWWVNAVFFGTWVLFVVYALLQPIVARSHRRLLQVGGGLWLLVPIANGWTTGAWIWDAWAAGQWAVVGVDVGSLLGGVAAIALAICIRVDDRQDDPEQVDTSKTNNQNVSAKASSSPQPTLRPEDLFSNSATASPSDEERS